MTYLKTTGNVNQRKGATTADEVIQVIPKGKKVKFYGYTFISGSTTWYLIEYGGKLGFTSGHYLKAV